ncbi:MAG: (d)CMP kinase, partial [Polyangiaceae bacterium]|nr:(d)CMP kinase [Polyangiaceae bacterium]
MTTTPRSRPVVAIDGPAGAGKSTAARMLAERLGFVLVDTGSLYRGTAYAALERGLSLDDGAALGAMAETLSFAFEEAAGGE